MAYTQFGNADLNNVSFAGSDLYRTSFTESRLCNIDFEGANLREAFMRFALFSGDLTHYFHNTAWWLAKGWNLKQLKLLQSIKVEPEVLADSTGFMLDLNVPTQSARDSTINTLQRAQALNGVAWQLATWGVNLARAPNSIDPEDTGCAPTTETSDVPKFALAAVDQAICVAKSLQGTASSSIDAEIASQRIDSALANFYDTKAYILMQLALNHLDIHSQQGVNLLRQAESLLETSGPDSSEWWNVVSSSGGTICV